MDDLPKYALPIAVYMLSTVMATQLLKTKLFFSHSGAGALLTSWLIGVIIFVGLHLLFLEYEITVETVSLFVIVTGITNSTYKFLGLNKLLKRWLK